MSRASFEYRDMLTFADLTSLSAQEDTQQSIENSVFETNDNLRQLAREQELTRNSMQENNEKLVYAIQRSADEIAWCLETVKQEIIITNNVLGKINTLLKNSDVLKQKEEKIEQALQFLNNAQYNNKLLKDAEECLLEALALDKRDWFVMQRLGHLYFYTTDKLVNNPGNAIRWLKNSIDYTEPMTYSNSVRINNYLSNAFSADGDKEPESVETMKEFTAYSYFLLGHLYFGIHDFKNLYLAYKKAHMLHPSKFDYAICYAKALVINEEGEEAALILKDFIMANRYLADEVVNDIDLSKSVAISEMLRVTTMELRQVISKKLNAIGLDVPANSVTIPVLDRIKEEMNSDNVAYLQSLLDSIEAKRKWDFEAFAKTITEDIPCSHYTSYQKLMEHNRHAHSIVIAIQMEEVFISEFRNEHYFATELEKKMEQERRTREADEQMQREKKEQEESMQRRKEEKKHNEAEIILQMGIDDEAEQDKKWVFKDYSGALTMYERAVEMGLEEAENYITAVKKKMK